MFTQLSLCNRGAWRISGLNIGMISYLGGRHRCWDISKAKMRYPQSLAFGDRGTLQISTRNPFAIPPVNPLKPPSLHQSSPTVPKTQQNEPAVSTSGDLSLYKSSRSRRSPQRFVNRRRQTVASIPWSLSPLAARQCLQAISLLWRTIQSGAGPFKYATVRHL